MNPSTIIIRPPSEADSILLQVTKGCSHNKCSFCGIYKSSTFSIRPLEHIVSDIKIASKKYTSKRSLFLCDGDALIIPYDLLLAIFKAIKFHLPWVDRISTYANAKSIARKSDTQLLELRAHGLKMVHIGLESGDDLTLQHIKKWGSAQELIYQSKRVQNASISVFATVLLGIGGAARTTQHAIATGKMLTEIDPKFVGALTLMILPETDLHGLKEKGAFVELDSTAILNELYQLLQHTNLSSGVFYSNHASNYLSLRVRFPHDKVAALAQIEKALSNTIPLRPEWLRAL